MERQEDALLAKAESEAMLARGDSRVYIPDTMQTYKDIIAASESPAGDGVPLPSDSGGHPESAAVAMAPVPATAAFAEDEVPGCPAVSLVEELQSAYVFENDASTDPDLNISNVWITDVASNCVLENERTIIEIALKFEGQTGPRARLKANGPTMYSYPFFAAVTTPQGRVLRKEFYAADLTYRSADDYVTATKTVRFVIPGKLRQQSLQDVLIGFQLTPNQLQYNRYAGGALQ